jgi:hypothetical protein
MAANHTVQLYRDAREFRADLEPWLLRNEDLNNPIISIAHTLASADHPFREPIYLASVKHGDAIIGCAIAATPDGLELTDLPSGVAPSLVASMAALRPDLHLVGGTEVPALEFAREWAKQRGGSWQVRHNWNLFRLDAVVAPRPVSGRLRMGEQSDWPWIGHWAPAYTDATNTTVDVTGFFKRRLRRNELYLWDHDGPKTVVTLSGNTPRGVRVTSVYTPAPFRGCGYATNAVAAASRLALEGGAQFCVLFADREPSVPARIYRAVGYRPIRDHLAVDLVP